MELAIRALNVQGVGPFAFDHIPANHAMISTALHAPDMALKTVRLVPVEQHQAAAKEYNAVKVLLLIALYATVAIL